MKLKSSSFLHSGGFCFAVSVLLIPFYQRDHGRSRVDPPCLTWSDFLKTSLFYAMAKTPGVFVCEVPFNFLYYVSSISAGAECAEEAFDASGYLCFCKELSLLTMFGRMELKSSPFFFLEVQCSRIRSRYSDHQFTKDKVPTRATLCYLNLSLYEVRHLRRLRCPSKSGPKEA